MSKTTPPSNLAGQAILRSLQKRGMSQRALAEQLDVSPAYVSSLLSGKKSLSPPTADKVATVMAMASAEATGLHRAAAQDQGFRLDLPDDFDDPM